MADRWLHIAGLGENGPSPALQALVASADVVLGSDRHHALTPEGPAQRLTWPSPFDHLLTTLKSLRGRRVVVLVTGDPLWFSAGTKLARAFADECIVHPALSAFQWAAARMGWSLADTDCLTVHGRPVEQMIPAIVPGARLLILTTGADTPGQIARILTDRGYGPSRMSVLSHLGGAEEARWDGTAATWNQLVPDFNTLAVDVIAGPGAQVWPRSGLPDVAFAHDGTMTKSEIRAITLSHLVPRRGALLWDVGCGAGSVAVEWMRAAPEARAIGIEPRADRRALAAQNALTLGTPALRLVEGIAPDALAGLPPPDAVFFGGGLTEAGFDAARAALRPFGRIVANAVTLETEALLLSLHARHGGSLTRIAIARAEPVGGLTGWRPAMPVTQWLLAP